MPRFFVSKEQIQDKKAFIGGEDARHIKTVLRCKTGEQITLCDGKGMDYEGVIKEISEKIIVQIQSQGPSSSEPVTKIILFQGLPKADKMEWILQKGIELGIDKIVPVITERTIVKLDKKEEKKLERWRKIAESAAKQSGRGKIPDIGAILSFPEAVKQASQMDGAIIPYEKEKEMGIRQFIQQFNGKTIAVMIGPEGGFSEKEIEEAGKMGILPITLGKRILRTETAGIVTAAILLYELG